MDGYIDVHFFITVRQKNGSRHYQGEMLIAGETMFEFEVVSDFSLSQYKRVLEEVKPEDLPNRLRVIVRKDGAEIPLSLEENQIFLELVFAQVYRLYRAVKKAKKKKYVRSVESAVSEGNGYLSLAPEICLALGGPKFGCTLLDPQVEPGTTVS